MRTFDRRALMKPVHFKSQEKLQETLVPANQSGEGVVVAELPQEEIKKSSPFKKWFLAFFLIVGLGLIYFVYLWLSHPRPFVSIHIPEQVSLQPLINLEFKDTSFFSEWREHVFHNKTVYKIEAVENNEKVLHALSHAASSAFFKEVNISSSERPFLTWEWKAVRFPSNKQNKVLAARSDNDYVGRIYVAFRGRTPLSSDVIQYVWDDYFPVGTTGGSPFARSNKVFVIRNGPATSPDGWTAEKRDLVADYQKLFGKAPHGNVMVIGLMSDSDNTGTESEAYFRRFSIQKPKI